MLARKTVALAAALAGAVIASRLLFGPFHLVLPVNTPLNAEGVFGLAVTVLLAWGGRSFFVVRQDPQKPPKAATLFCVCTVVLIAVAAFAPSLRFSFLSDDFILVKGAPGWMRQQLGALFTTGGGDGYYRPIGAASLVVNSAWASFHPAHWHASALALHALNCVLVLLLAWRLGASRLAGWFAAALFAVHGTRPEAVVWVAARFDLLATFFVLAGLLLFLRSTGERGGYYRAGALAAMVLAILSKEVAYIFPLLLLLDPAGRRLKAAWPFFLVAAALFAYRWSLFGGIGGYRAGGRLQTTSLGLASVKALALRLWGALYFPINWSTEPGTWLAVLAVLYMIALLWTARPAKAAWFAAGFTLISAIPALQLLGIAADLGNSRVLYLPSAGFCLLLASALDGIGGWRRATFPAIVLAFHFAALEHNLANWAYTSDKTKAACDIAADYARSTTRLAAEGLPITLRGVPSLANGFAECIAMETGKPVELSKEADVLLTWDRTRDQLICARGCK